VSDKQDIVIIGYGGHAYVVIDALVELNCPIKYYADINSTELNPFNLRYLGNEQSPESEGWNMNISYVLGIGNNKIREKIGKNILERNSDLLTVVHPFSNISKKTEIGKGVFISKGALVNPLTSIHDFVVLNTGCIIEHECTIEQAAHIAPGAVLAGNVYVGKRSFVGANAVVKQGVRIGDDVVIGAGSVILKDIPDGSIFVGNPAHDIK
jgi:sugar O-acyltransferase (sialic acid O-acetyltransferase NeuD family)